MGSSFRQWESDPLFSAAEVVQDSADRMGLTFRLLLHELSLIQEDHQDANLMKSVDYYRRDLATAIETAKWQLEDFEREVNISAAADKSHAKENVISKHRQFISAIRGQILDVGKSLKDISAGDLLKSTARLAPDEQDRNQLALFLLGENSGKHAALQELEDNDSLRRFLDPTTSSNLRDKSFEHLSGDHLHMNGFANLDQNFDFMENNLRNVGSQFSTNRNFEASSSLQQAAYGRHNEGGCWDLEANEAPARTVFDEISAREYNSGMNFFGFLGPLWFKYGKARRSFTKRWKDGEEQRKSQYHALRGNCRQLSLSSGYVHFQAFYSELFARGMQLGHWISQFSARCRRSPYYARAKGYFMLLIPAIILSLIVLGNNSPISSVATWICASCLCETLICYTLKERDKEQEVSGRREVKGGGKRKTRR